MVYQNEATFLFSVLIHFSPQAIKFNVTHAGIKNRIKQIKTQTMSTLHDANIFLKKGKSLH